MCRTAVFLHHTYITIINNVFFKCNFSAEQHTIDSSVDGNIYLDDVFTTSVINILWVMVANTRFARGDPRMDHLTSCMNGFIRNSNGGPSMLTFWPFLRYIAPRLSGYDNLIQHVGPLRAYIEVSITAPTCLKLGISNVSNVYSLFADLWLASYLYIGTSCGAQTVSTSRRAS